MSSLQYSYVRRWRGDIKTALVYASGGKCSLCGYSVCEAGLEFHHVDPKEKDFAISAWDSLNTGSITNEVTKCILVCCRCHREIHANIVSIDGMTSTFNVNEFNNKYQELKNSHSIPCDICGNPIHKNTKYCSLKCKNIANNIITWDKHQLESLIINKKMTFNEISNEYKVSVNSIKYYAIKFGLYIPKQKSTPYNRLAFTRKPDKDTLYKLILMYSLTEVGRQFGVTCTSVRKWCKSYNMDVHKFKSFTYDDLMTCYNDKMTKADIIKKFGIGKERLNNMCKKYNLVFPSPNIKYSSDIMHKVIDMRNSGIKFTDIALALNLSQSTVYHLYQKRNNT